MKLDEDEELLQDEIDKLIEAATGEINDRARVLLKALVERHIRDGQPVGSRVNSTRLPWMTVLPWVTTACFTAYLHATLSPTPWNIW